MKTKKEKEHDAELKRLTQAVSNSNAAKVYNGNLVVELLVELGCIQRTPTEMRRWGRSY